VKRLKDESDPFGAQPRAAVFIERGEIRAGQCHAAGTGRVQAREQSQQGGFSRARGTDNGN
jgi:hypothetical protein